MSGNRKKGKNKRSMNDGRDYDLQEDEAEKPSKRPREMDDSIYGDIGDYVPTRSGKHRDMEDKRAAYFDKNDNEPVDNAAPTFRVNKSAEILTKLQQEPEGYAECYPGVWNFLLICHTCICFALNVNLNCCFQDWRR